MSAKETKVKSSTLGEAWGWGVTACWNEHFFPPLGLRDQGHGQGNGVPAPL